MRLVGTPETSFLGTVGKVVFLGEPVEKRSSWISPVRSEQIDTQNQLGVEVYCRIQPRSLTINFDSGFVYCDPLRLRQRQNTVLTGSQERAPVNSGGSGTLSAIRCTY